MVVNRSTTISYPLSNEVIKHQYFQMLIRSIDQNRIIENKENGCLQSFKFKSFVNTF
jgi:hypothetical protein